MFGATTRSCESFADQFYPRKITDVQFVIDLMFQMLEELFEDFCRDHTHDVILLWCCLGVVIVVCIVFHVQDIRN